MAGWVLFDNVRRLQLTANAINFGAAGDTLKVMLCTSAYVPDQTSHQFKNDVRSATTEVVGGNYTAGGVTLASKTATVTAHVFTFDCADLLWSQHAAGFTSARIAVLYKDTGAEATSPLIAYYVLAEDKGNVAADLPMKTPAGIFTAAMALLPYDTSLLHQFMGAPIDFAHDVLKLALLTTAYVPDQTAHAVLSDVVGAEVSGTNYTAGGVTLTGLGVTVAAHVAAYGVSPRLDPTNPQWAKDPGGFTNGAYAVLYKSTGVATTSPLVGYWQLSANNVTADLQLYFPTGLLVL